jgi:hypothetical protein
MFRSSAALGVMFCHIWKIYYLQFEVQRTETWIKKIVNKPKVQSTEIWLSKNQRIDKRYRVPRYIILVIVLLYRLRLIPTFAIDKIVNLSFNIESWQIHTNKHIFT